MTVNRAAGRSIVDHPRLDRVIQMCLKVMPASDSVPNHLWLGHLATLPSVANGIVSISFDGGHDSDYKAARAILQDCGTGAAASYITVDKVRLPGRVSTTRLTEMREHHDWDIAAHVSIDLTTLDRAGVRRKLETIRSFLLECGYLEDAAHFALPAGRYNDLVLCTSQGYFTSIRTIENAPETLASEDPFRLRIFYRGSYATESQVEKALACYRERRCWIHMVSHRIGEQTGGAPEPIRTDSFERPMRRVTDSDLLVKTIPKVMHNQSSALA